MEEEQQHKYICKFCSKRFPCGRSLGGHMRSHLFNIDQSLSKLKQTPKAAGDQWKHCKKCGSSFSSWKALFGHMKCHSVNGRRIVGLDKVKRYTHPKNSSFDIDQQEQEEVALSLIILSRDQRDWGACQNYFLDDDPPLVKRSDHGNGFTSEFCQDSSKKMKFTCSICEKGFPSYQALGGHKANQKKFKGGCAARSHQTVIQEHKCPICLKLFPSGQALGAHKRSHLEPKIQSSFDLNLPAPPEEDCNHF